MFLHVVSSAARIKDKFILYPSCTRYYTNPNSKFG